MAIEDIHHPTELKTLILKHSECGPRLRMHLADDGPRLLGKQVDIDGMDGHELGDESLILHTQIVRSGKTDIKEMPPEGLPERRTSILVDDAAHLGNDLGLEPLSELGHEQKAAQRQESPIALFRYSGDKKRLPISEGPLFSCNRWSMRISLRMFRTFDSCRVVSI